MYLGFSSNAYTNYDVIDAIHSISSIGFSGIELLIDHPHIFLPITNEKIFNIKNKIKKDGISISNLNVNTVLGWYEKKQNANKFEPSLSNPDPKLRNWRISYSKKAIDLAVRLDSPSICVTSGNMNKTNTFEEYQLFKNSLNEIAEYAEKNNIRIAIEYEPGLLIGTATDVWKLLSNDFNNVGLNLDTCHASVLDENISGLIKKFNQKIFHIHISDCKDRFHYHLIPGNGSIDFQTMFDSLKEIKYNGFLSAELYTYSDEPDQAALDTFNYLQKFLN